MIKMGVTEGSNPKGVTRKFNYFIVLLYYLDILIKIQLHAVKTP